MTMESTWLILYILSAGLVIYGQTGYAVLCITVRLAAGLFQRDASVCPFRSNGLPSVTLIVPAHNEEGVLQRKLENSLALDYPRSKLEIIVASDGSTDRTAEIARGFESQGVSLLHFPQQRGKASAVNDAAAKARGEVLFLCDANVMFRPDALLRLVTPLQNAAVGAVSGDVRLASEESNFGQGESLYYRVERAIQVGESRIGSMMGVDGGMYVVRRELFQSLAASTILDDLATTMNVINQGKRVVYEPTAVATENGTPGAREEFRRRVRLAAGAAQLLKRGAWPTLRRPIELGQFLSHKLVRWIEPFVLVALFAANIVLWSRGLLYQITLAGQTLFYLAAILGWVSLRFRSTKLGGVAFYFVMSHVAMAIGLVKGIFNLQRVTWGRTERNALGAGLDAIRN